MHLIDGIIGDVTFYEESPLIYDFYDDEKENRSMDALKIIIDESENQQIK